MSQTSMAPAQANVRKTPSTLLPFKAPPDEPNRRHLPSPSTVQPPRPQPSPLSQGSLSSPNSPNSTVGSSASGRGSLSDRLQPKLMEAMVVQMPGQPSLEPDDDLRQVCREIADAIVGLGSSATDTFKVLQAGLRDPLNHALRANLRCRALKVAQFISMKEADLMNPAVRAAHEREMNDRLKQRNVQALLAANAGPGTDMFKCPQCGKRNCAMNQKQTRSGDEPMTIFLTCLECYRVFRK